jgi:hypothetical protein
MERLRVDHAAARRWEKRKARGYESVTRTGVEDTSAGAGDALTALLRESCKQARGLAYVWALESR